MEKRFVVFLLLSVAIFFGNMAWEIYLQQQKLAKNPPVAGGKDLVAGKDKPNDKDKKPNDNGADKGAKPPAGDQGKPAVAQAPKAPAAGAEKSVPEQWFTLGSAAPGGPDNPYRMLVTFTNMGAAVERIELNSPRYGDLEKRYGYLGHLALSDTKGGAKVNVVGPGTPAAVAGLEVGDVITSLDGNKVGSAQGFIDELKKTNTDQKVALVVLRAGVNKNLSATLGRPPLEVIRPELDTDPLDVVTAGGHDPFSLLLTLQEAGNDALAPGDEEIPGLNLRTGGWQGRNVGPDAVEFEKVLPQYGLKVIKRFTLARIPKDPTDLKSYHLTLRIEIQNTSTAPQAVAYQLDGPTSLPTEGWWYANRISRDMGGIGLRDVALQFENSPTQLVSSLKMADQRLKEIDALKQKLSTKEFEPEVHKETAQTQLLYGGVDAQYFAVVLLPQRAEGQPPWLENISEIVVGNVPQEAALRKKVDVTCRFTSAEAKLEPGKSLVHEYQVFTGPKQPRLLEQYTAGSKDLGELVYYGWFSWVARPMLSVLEFFYMIVGNYGIAIIMLTVLVRLCMFPLSRKQAISAKKMQELAPETKKINERYKNNAQERTKATQELWRKNNYNPMGGCLLVFIQLPIFMGLYRSLMVDVELRQAPLLGSAVRWCSNLAAPDMLWNWTDRLPAMLGSETGWFGPYLNLLPLITVALFLWQQKMFMPPATDDTTAMQQKIMKYMMVFMAVMFFKVASGLCLYFIASSLWGIGERKLLPGMVGAGGANAAGAGGSRNPAATPSGNGADGTSNRRKQRGRK